MDALPIDLALLAADWAQTRYIAEHPAQFYETNRFLGPHPSTTKVNKYFAANVAAALVFSYTVKEPYRSGGLWAQAAVEAYYVQRNYHIGVRFSF